MIYRKYSILMLALFLSSAHATELTHHFVSPTNGGNALNGSFLLNQAEAQNNFKDPVAVAAAAAAAAKATNTTSTTQTNLDNFKNKLQAAILSRISDNSVTKLFDATSGNIIPGESLHFDLNGDGNPDYELQVGQPTTGDNRTISITITDYSGIGGSTTLTIPYTGL
jgi:curli production assembly/transport component CsgF